MKIRCYLFRNNDNIAAGTSVLVPVKHGSEPAFLDVPPFFEKNNAGKKSRSPYGLRLCRYYSVLGLNHSMISVTRPEPTV